MSMCLAGSPPDFQYLAEIVLARLTKIKAIPYMDDCIVFSRSAEKLNERFREAFPSFRDPNFKINPLKCEFIQQNVPFIGHVVSQNVTQANPAE